MSTSTIERPLTTDRQDDVVRLPRRRIDKLLIGFGVIAAMVFAAAGGLLTWGADFANDYVHDELSSQRVFFPDEASLREEGRDDLVRFADQQVTTGSEAEAYAGFIAGHMQGIADGKTYAEIDDRGAAQAWSTPAKPAPARRRSPTCRPPPTSSRPSATRCSGARRSGVCCSRASPGRPSGGSPPSPPGSPSPAPPSWLVWLPPGCCTCAA